MYAIPTAPARQDKRPGVRLATTLNTTASPSSASSSSALPWNRPSHSLAVDVPTLPAFLLHERERGGDLWGETCATGAGHAPSMSGSNSDGDFVDSPRTTVKAAASRTTAGGSVDKENVALPSVASSNAATVVNHSTGIPALPSAATATLSQSTVATPIHPSTVLRTPGQTASSSSSSSTTATPRQCHINTIKPSPAISTLKRSLDHLRIPPSTAKSSGSSIINATPRSIIRRALGSTRSIQQLHGVPVQVQPWSIDEKTDSFDVVATEDGCLQQETPSRQSSTGIASATRSLHSHGPMSSSLSSSSKATQSSRQRSLQLTETPVSDLRPRPFTQSGGANVSVARPLFRLRGDHDNDKVGAAFGSTIGHLLPDEHNEDDDIFGLGAFQDVFITEEDLDRAREKLDAEEVKTQEEVVEEYMTTVMQWAMEDVTDSMVAAVDTSTPCDFCYNFVVLGRGHIVSSMTTMASDDGEHTSVQWHGRMHLSGDNGDVHIRLPLLQVSDIRSKCIDDEPAMVMMTVDNEHFLQLVVETPEMANVVTKGINSAIHARATSRRSRELLEIGHERVRALDEATVERDRRLAEVMSAYEARVAAIEHEAERRRSELESSAMDIDETITAKSAVALPVTSTTHVDDEHHNDDHTMTTGCPLCFADDVQPEVELQPCGHRLCVECADRMQELELKQCPWDRREIERFRRHGCRCDDDDGSDTRTTSGTMASPTIRP